MTAADRSPALAWHTAAAAAAYRGRDMRLAESLIFPAVLDSLGYPPGPDAVVLDIGCGTGVLAAHIAVTRGWTVSAFDISPHMLDIARVDNAHPRVEHRLFDGNSLSEIADSTIDAAVCCLVYCCDPEDRRLATLTSEIHRVLRPGGPYILADLNPGATGEQFSTLLYGEPGATYADGDSAPVALRRLDGSVATLTCHYRSLATYISFFTGAGFPAPDVALPAAAPSGSADPVIAPYMVLTARRAPSPS
ncbi:class I SAM-dependent methyltransferase [Nocardia sp. NPDC046473]|uniref:class I SAM-dependent methyltransferase n=1 Tax=Nocardia sp. NPDC046473 TaxID=3155733 RepID=UPI0033CAF6FA